MVEMPLLDGCRRGVLLVCMCLSVDLVFACINLFGIYIHRCQYIRHEQLPY